MATDSEWTDELKQEIIEKYTEAEPTPENTSEILADLAEEYGKTVNGVRLILSKAGVYVKKGKTAAPAADKPEGSKRVSKADSLKGLTDKLESLGVEADLDIIGRMTAKAAVYFTDVLTKVSGK